MSDSDSSRPAPRIVKCPACGRDVVWGAESPYRPFCSARCRQLDLGAWASEQYRIPAANPPDPEDEDKPS